MRILYIDIDCQRPDHLGCYGYHRNTSPHIDSVAQKGLRFDAVYASDAPCLPSRTALFSGRFGTNTGVVGHGGTAAEPFIEGPKRGFGSTLGRTSWMRALRDAGLTTASVSPFAERHSAWHWYAGFSEVINTGKRGLETADEIAPAAIDWIRRNHRNENWFLHVNFWDPHTPYRSPDAFGNPFEKEPLPSWLTEEVRKEHWNGCGPHSAQEPIGFSEVSQTYKDLYPKQPLSMNSMGQVRRMFDGYDTGVLYADTFVGKLFDTLTQLGIAEETAIMISADHGEALGELNVYADHQLADEATCRVPLILKWPGVTDSKRGLTDSGLYYQFDVAATIIELAGGKVPQNWHGASFAEQLRDATSLEGTRGRPELVLTQGAWTCQRALRFRQDAKEYLCIRSYHDGYHGFPDVMLFDLATDPNEQTDLAQERPDVVRRAVAGIDTWLGQRMAESQAGVDPLWTVIKEGGPKHTVGELETYLTRLRATQRDRWADLLENRHLKMR